MLEHYSPEQIIYNIRHDGAYIWYIINYWLWANNFKISTLIRRQFQVNNNFFCKPATLLIPIDLFLFPLVEELYSTRYQSASFFLLMWRIILTACLVFLSFRIIISGMMEQRNSVSASLSFSQLLLPLYLCRSAEIRVFSAHMCVCVCVHVLMPLWMSLVVLCALVD